MQLFPEKTLKRRRETPSTDSLQAFRQNLPVYQFRKELIHCITGDTDTDNKVVLVVAETGSGKSTQIPAYLLSSHHRMAVTQPRRVAAVTLAHRVSTEHATVTGQRIGYRVRFDDCTSTDTQLTYVTAGMLLREAMVDPLLRRYSILFLDEAHERSLQTDILLGVVVRARRARASSRPLKIVVMSATLHVETFQTFFGKENVHTVRIPGRQYPVQLLYTQTPVEDFLESALTTVLNIHETEDEGDILVFLPGQEEIEDLAALLRQYLQEEEADQWTGDKVEDLQAAGKANLNHNTPVVSGVMICLLYAALPPDVQLAAFADKPENCTRKIILATNIAETSITLPGIRYVVDSGKHKCRHVLPTGMDSLSIQPVSQAQAAQRSGRAGRIQAGVCFRLYTEESFHKLAANSVPEILRVNLAQVVLQLKGMGITDPASFDFVTPPDQASLVRATKLLYALAALDDKMELTDYGKKLAKLPLDPVFGHLLLQSAEYGCVSEMLSAVAVLSAENLFYRPTGEGGPAAKAGAAHRRFASHEGDLPTFLNVYSAWQKEAVYVPPSSGGLKAQKKRLKLEKQQVGQKGQGHAKLLHGEWCQRNYISGRALARAYHVRQQLQALCARPADRNGLGMDVNLSAGKDREVFLKCAAAGLFLQAASRVKTEREVESNNRGRSGTAISTRGRYRTKLGNENVSIHPTSTLFGRHPSPSCVVFTEMVTTTRTYIRGVTQIREEWLHEVAPNFYS